MNKIFRNKKCPKCGSYLNRGLSNDAIILKKGSILLILRKIDPYKGHWALPGGMVDWDETIPQSVVREVREETGLTVTELTLLGVYSQPKRHPQQAVAVAYIAKTRGTPKAGDDAQEYKYFPLANLPKSLAFDHEEIIEDYMRLVK